MGEEEEKQNKKVVASAHRWAKTALGGLPGEQAEAVDTEAVSAHSLDRLPQHLATLLAFVLVLHGHRQHAERDARQRDAW